MDNYMQRSHMARNSNKHQNLHQTESHGQFQTTAEFEFGVSYILKLFTINNNDKLIFDEIKAKFCVWFLDCD